jgi:rhomboid protease GluP
MHAYAMRPEPSLTDRLIAAMMLADPTVHALERSSRQAVVAAGPLRVLVIEALSLEELAAAMQGRKLAGVVLVNTAGLHPQGLKYTSWRPGLPPERNGMFAWGTLEAGLKKLDQVQDAEAIIAQREKQGDEVARFVAPLMKRRPYVTYGVAALSIALFGLQMLWGGGEPVSAASRMGADVPSLIRAGEWWRVLAPMALHGSIAHLAMNMIALFGFGTFLERFLGSRRYLVLYVVSGAGGALASLLRPQDVVAVGASGGIWGLMVAGAVLVTWPRGRLPELVTAAQRRRAWTPVVINFLYSFQPGIDVFAHFGGGLIGGLLLLSGLATAGIPVAAESNDAQRPPLREGFGVTAAAIACAVAFLGSFGVAFAKGHPWELQERPPLSRVPVSGLGATIELPRLIGAELREPQVANERIYGNLKYDPAVFLVFVPKETLTAEEQADATEALRASIPSIKPTKLDGFTVVTQTELRQLSGRPYLYFREGATDGRTAEGYWVTEGDRFAQILVLTTKETSAGWRQAAAQVPFTLSFETAR